MNEDLHQRVNKLESIITYQDQILDDLNSVIIEQGKNIEKLEKETENLKKELENINEEKDDRPPPHY